MSDMDMSHKRYRCSRCGVGMSSKNPALRSIFLDRDDGPPYLGYMQGVTLMRVVDDPARPGERGMQMLTTGERWTAPPGKDLEVRITIPDCPPSELAREPDAQDPGKVLLGWLRTIRAMPEAQVRQLVCALTGGHAWEREKEEVVNG